MASASAVVIATNAPPPGATNWATVDADSAAVADIGPTMRWRAAEGRVEDEGGRRGVEADDGRDAPDRRVRERLRDQDGLHRQFRDVLVPHRGI